MKNLVRHAYLKVREYLNTYGYDNISFDFSSYADEKDIPAITYKGERRKVCEFIPISEGTIGLVLSPYWHIVVININDIDDDELLALLQDVYYETNESADVGDFEMDLLGVK